MAKVASYVNFVCEYTASRRETFSGELEEASVSVSPRFLDPPRGRVSLRLIVVAKRVTRQSLIISKWSDSKELSLYLDGLS